MQRLEDGSLEIKGPSEAIIMPLSHINVVAQVRKNYGSKEDTEELSHSIYQRGVLQRPTIVYFSSEGAKLYLDSIRGVFGVKHKFSDLKSVEIEGAMVYPIAVMGHRRLDSMRQLCEEDDILGEVNLRVHVMKGDEVDILDILSKQYQENFHKRLDSVEAADALHSIYQFGLKRGDYKSYADCASKLGGITDESIAKAMRYYSLPLKVRKLVEKWEQDKKDSNKKKKSKNKKTKKDDQNKVGLSFGRSIMLSHIAATFARHQIKDKDIPEKDRQIIQSKANMKRLLLTDMIKFFSKEEKDRLIDHIMGYAGQLIKFESSQDAEKFTKSVISDLDVDGQQLVMFEVSAEELRKEEDRIARQATRRLLIRSLSALAITIEGDIHRIETERQPVVAGSPTAIKLLDILEQGIERLSMAGDGESDEMEILGWAHAAQFAAQALKKGLEEDYEQEIAGAQLL